VTEEKIYDTLRFVSLLTGVTAVLWFL